jgi:Endoplasmic Reticulum-Golgi Intermediate Compartment (ERGIC)
MSGPPGGSVAGTRLQWVGRLDMYRKVPNDLLEGTRRGSIFSYVAVFIMTTLFLLETGAFFEKK